VSPNKMTDTNDDLALDMEMDAFEVISEENGIKHTHWSFYDIKASQMNDPHPFGGAKWVANDGGCCSNKKVKLHGTRWIDVWIAFDRLREKEAWIDTDGNKQTCDHHFIEGFERRGVTLFVSTGS